MIQKVLIKEKKQQQSNSIFPTMTNINNSLLDRSENKKNLTNI